MPRYRCYFLNGDRIKAVENIETSDDGAALAEAERLILKSEFLTAEVWQEKRLVGRYTIAPDPSVIIGGQGDAST